MTVEQEPVRKKKADPPKLEFEAGKVFSPAEARNDLEDLAMEFEASRFHAQKGQSGDRRQA